MYVLLNMGIFQPAMLVYERVTETASFRNPHPNQKPLGIPNWRLLQLLEKKLKCPPKKHGDVSVSKKGNNNRDIWVIAKKKTHLFFFFEFTVLSIMTSFYENELDRIQTPKKPFFHHCQTGSRFHRSTGSTSFLLISSGGYYLPVTVDVGVRHAGGGEKQQEMSWKRWITGGRIGRIYGW